MTNHQLAPVIIQQTLKQGAAVAGIADMVSLRAAPSYAAMEKYPNWPAAMQSALVFGVAHRRSTPALDWWDARPGGTPGNRQLMDIQKQLKAWLQTALNIGSVSLPYQEHQGGIFLKDAAALAGLGVIGRNNLLLTPDYGPQIRWRAMFLDADLPASELTGFDPCAACPAPCLTACPQDAFATGSYDRARCSIQMDADVDHPYTDDGISRIHYCRACELACPVAPKG